MTVPAFVKRKRTGPPLVVLTAYDVPTTTAAEAGGVDAILVGDSLGNVLLGETSTLTVTLDQVIHHARAVGRARRRALLIVDMPWMTYHLGAEDAVRNAARVIKETGADAVKLEGGRKRATVVRALLDAEIPVMGHIGLTPQSVLPMGGYRVQGRNADRAEALLDDAKALVEAGVFSIVLEGIPGPLAARITEQIEVPTIGIGAGVHCDGQVLVFHDLLGMSPESPPKFVRRYAHILETQIEAIRRWTEDVRGGTFPSDEETYR
jgi:3-methyl-2-oxobutanoate hydroxymethyltransferase